MKSKEEAACVDDRRIATILLPSPPRSVASPQPHRPYTFLKALFKTRLESISTCVGRQHDANTRSIGTQVTGSQRDHGYVCTIACTFASTRTACALP